VDPDMEVQMREMRKKAVNLGSVWEHGSTRVPKKFEIFFFIKI
jgi:hypothetical protein